MIFIIVGKSCSGKTSAKEYFESKGLISFEASKYMNESIKKYNLPSEELFQKFGKCFVSKLIHNEIKNINDDATIVISGLRTPEEIKFFKDKVKTKIIGIQVSNKTCFERNIERNRGDIENDYNSFIRKRIEFDSKIGLSEVFENFVDTWIENENTIEELHNQLGKILEKENENC